MNDLTALAPDLKNPRFYINRELSLLEFHRRVLEEARLEEVPLLERLRYLCIFSTNLDEFFEVRVAGLAQQAEIGSPQTGPDQMTAQEILRAISVRVHELVAQQYELLNQVIDPLLVAERIRFIPRGQWTSEQHDWLHRHFVDELQPILSPLSLDPAHPFPRILNKSLNFIIELEGKDAFGRESGIAIVQAPRALPRLIRLPVELCGGEPHNFVFLSSAIHAFVDELFIGMSIRGCYQFRVTRNSDLFVDPEEIGDLRRALEGELLSRRYGDAVRLEVADDCPPDVAKNLLDHFDLGEKDLYQVNGPVNLSRLEAVYDLVDRPALKYPSFTPGLPANLGPDADLFDLIARNDILLHHPFESFLPVTEFVRRAAADPTVLALRQTLYRTGPDSAIVDSLVSAARAGKEVTVVIELRARFEEAANIQLANRLEEAGAHVVYGVVGFKTHAKMILVLRREAGKLRQYAHLGTGNYHPRTARNYTDYGLFTAKQELCDDVYAVFLQLTSAGSVVEHSRIMQSPFTLHEGLLNKIDREAQHARNGRPARIVVKVNSLVEPRLIEALYRASRGGARIDLIVRGMCAVRPGIAGVSENIRVRSIVGRFLEHARVYSFHNDGADEVYCSSADWMERNMFRRVETAFPIEDPRLRERVLMELDYYFQDNTDAWQLDSEGNYHRCTQDAEPPFSAQGRLLDSLSEHS